MTKDPRFAKNWVELAGLLGTTRRTLQTWREDPRFAGRLPEDKSDGRKDVIAWRKFVDAHDLLRQAEAPAPAAAREASPEFLEQAQAIAQVAGTEADWRKLLLVEKVEQARAETGEVKGALIVAAELEGPLGAVLVAVTNFLTQLPERLAPEVLGFRNVHEVTEIIRLEAEAGLTGLNTAGYLLEAGALAAALPWDEESQTLFKQVEFAGMDRTPWRKLIEVCVCKILRKIGEAAIAVARSRPADVAHAVTGQVTDDAEEGNALERAGKKKKTRRKKQGKG